MCNCLCIMSEEDKERFNDWIPILEEVVKAVEDVYRNLENLKNVSLLAELQVVESWNM